MMKLLGLSENEISQALRGGQVTVAVYGLGKMGLPLACCFSQIGAQVIGVDINQQVVDQINQKFCPVQGEPGLPEALLQAVSQGRLTATTDGLEAAKKADVMVIIVPTLLDYYDNPDLSTLRSAVETIARGLSPGDLVIQESTVPPRTTRDLILPILKTSGLPQGSFGLAFCPERTMSGQALKDIAGSYPKVVGGIDQASTDAAAAIYQVINARGVIKVSNTTTAEMIKLSEGVFRDVNIALSNEMALVCHEFGVNPEEVFQVANGPFDEISGRHYFNFHQPGAGVGGHCIPVYPYFLTRTTRTDTSLIELARKINDHMPHHVINLVIEGLNEIQKSVKGVKILVMGLAFRGGVKEARYSPAIPIVQRLLELQADVYLHDPIFTLEEIAGTGAKPSIGFTGMDCLVIVTDHPQFREYNWSEISDQLNSRVLIDGRQVVDPEAIRSLGFVYKGIGRI